jgi:RHS repeat-associated protein
MSIHSHLPYDQSTSHARIPAGGIHLIASIDSASEAQVTASFFGSTKALHGEVATTTAETSTHNHSNQQYSITAVTTSAGAIAERYAYSAYGEPTICDASGSPLATQVSSLGNRYSYTGREWDATVGLHHFRARWMSPKTGRFLSRDPIGFEGGAFSIVEYCHSKPQDFLDPTGMQIRPNPALPGYPYPYPTSPLPPTTPPAPPKPLPAALSQLCNGIGSCPSCDPVLCAAAQNEIQVAFATANDAALGTWNGWIEGHNWGSYGGRCHFWSAEFCKDRNCKPANVGSCLVVTGHIIRLDGNSKWHDHNVNVIKNKCTGKCTVVDDGFWGRLGQVYDPCDVPVPPLVGPIGQGQWDSIRSSCGCGGGGPRR